MQDLKYAGEPSETIIGDRNTIRVADGQGVDVGHPGFEVRQPLVLDSLLLPPDNLFLDVHGDKPAGFADLERFPHSQNHGGLNVKNG